MLGPRARRAKRAFLGAVAAVWRRLHLAFPLAAAALTVYHTRLILGQVLNQSGDDSHHLMSESAVAAALRVGDNPLGPIGIDFGQPFLRFYQVAFDLFNAGASVLADVDVLLVHNAMIVVCLALSPFAYLYFLRKLGLTRWAGAFGSFLSMISVASFGNSIEAYHHTGIVTQCIGGLFFPLFLGSFIGMLRGEDRPGKVAVFFAVAFLSHVIMAVFTAFGAALYVLVADTPVRPLARRLAAFALLGLALVAFWVLPFIAHTFELRPIPDSIIRGSERTYWFNSVSKAELMMVVTTGRLLDDPPVIGSQQIDPRDKLMDRMSIMGTMKTRPPVVTALTAFGALVALLGIRRTSRRFLLSGLAFSLMLFAGPDDFRFLHALPFMKQIQSFRCTYFIELFAFGLAGLGIERVLAALWKLTSFRLAVVRLALHAALLAGLGAGSLWVGREIYLLGETHVRLRDSKFLDTGVDVASALQRHGYPFRVSPTYPARKVFQDWLARYGFEPYGTHWIAVGPTSGFHLAWALGSPRQDKGLYALSGVRWFVGNDGFIQTAAKARDEDGAPLFERLPNGADRHGRSNDTHLLLDLGQDSFLRPVSGKPVAVVCNDAEWIWIAKSWVYGHRGAMDEAETPFPVRVEPGRLGEAVLPDGVRAVIYLDRSRLGDDRNPLAALSRRGMVVVATEEIEGIPTVVANRSQPIWLSLPAGIRGVLRPSNLPPRREEELAALRTTWITALDTGRETHQDHAFDVDLLEPRLFVLPFVAVPGWRAELDAQPVPIYPAGPNMLGVFVPEGAHRLTFSWSMPAWHRICLIASLVGLAVILLSLICRRRPCAARGPLARKVRHAEAR